METSTENNNVAKMTRTRVQKSETTKRRIRTSKKKIVENEDTYLTNDEEQSTDEQDISHKSPIPVAGIFLIYKSSISYSKGNPENPMRRAFASMNINDKLVVNLIPTDKVYKYLSWKYGSTCIEHGNDDIPNDVPTLTQLYHNLTFYKKDLDLDDRLIEINVSFISTQLYRKKRGKQVSFYFNNEILSLKKRREITCKIYEHNIFSNRKAKNIFMILHEMFVKYDKPESNDFIIIIDPTLTSSSFYLGNITSVYMDYKSFFPNSLCLIEMLTKWPNRETFIWNIEND